VPISVDAATGKSFLREITSWNNLNHRNIVKLYDMNVMPLPYFEMELCDGNLNSLDKPLDVDESLHYIYEILTGLKHAHNKGIIHRDLKPHNILLKDGVPKISDWGLSKIASSSRTSTTSTFTPVYAAPEQLSAGTKVDERTDIYQIGVILYELVTGRLPFTGETLPQLITQILTEEPQKPSQYNPDAEKIESIILKCMSKDVNLRYRNIDELQKELAKPMRIEYQESLVQSRGDIGRTNFLSGELCLLCLRSGDIAGALKYGSSLQHYATGEIQEKISRFISDLEYRQKEGMAVPEEIIEEAVIVIHQVRMGR
jgi:serine/threonine protein kinase